MEDSLFNVYMYMFKSKGWFPKFAVLALLNIPFVYLLFLYHDKKLDYHSSGFYLLLLAVIITMFINAGYIARCAQNLIYVDGNNTNILPKWRGYFLEYLELGVKKLWFYIVAGFIIFPRMFSLRNSMSPSAGIDFTLEGLFCSDFNQEKHDFDAVLEVVRGNLGLYYKMAFMNLVVPIGFPLLFSILVYKLNLRIEQVVIVIVISFLFSYWALTSAYFSAVSARGMDVDLG